MPDIVYVTVLHRLVSGDDLNLIEGRGQYGLVEWQRLGGGGRVEWLTGPDHEIGIERCAGDKWRRVPESKVPNKVWAEIARRRLLGEGEN
jgi:hypothetical protein